MDKYSWKELATAYGTGEDIFQLLEKLSRFPSNEEVWNSLWSYLFHQGTIYTSSYAVVPCLVEILSKSTSQLNFNFFLMPVSIEISRVSGNAPEIPEEIKDDYYKSLTLLNDHAIEYLKYKLDASSLKSIFALIALTKGRINLAESLLSIDVDKTEKEG